MKVNVQLGFSDISVSFLDSRMDLCSNNAITGTNSLFHNQEVAVQRPQSIKGDLGLPLLLRPPASNP